MPLTLTSPAFGPKAEIPAVHTCEGADTSPPLEWSGVPGRAQSLALIVDDPDAPDPKAPRMTYVHWVLYNIAPAMTRLADGAAKGGLPPGTREGKNDWKRTGYGGPCPPLRPHPHFFQLFAPDTPLPPPWAPPQPHTAKGIEGPVGEEAGLGGKDQKKKKLRPGL